MDVVYVILFFSLGVITGTAASKGALVGMMKILEKQRDCLQNESKK